MTSEEADRLLRFARRLQRGIAVVVLLSLPGVWPAWHDQGRTTGLSLLVALLAVEVSSGLFLPWFFRLTVRRRGVAGDGPRD